MPYGLTRGELAQAYWQWMFSFPDDAHPAYEQGPVVYGTQHQPERFWILESGTPGVWVRSITIPAGKGLLFTLGDGCFNTLEIPGATETDLRTIVDSVFNSLDIQVSAEVDGTPIPLEDYFVISPLFELNVVNPAFGGIPSGSGEAIAAGTVVLLHPLSRGTHTLHLVVDVPEIGYSSDTTYHLTVK